MAFENCIAEIVQAGKGKIDEDEARRILGRVFDRATRHEKDGVSRADAALKAARELGDEERIAAAVEKRNGLINKQRRADLDNRVVPGKEADSVRAVLSSVEGNTRGFADSIDTAGQANTTRLIGGLISELRQKGLLQAVLRRNKDFERDLSDEMWRLEDPDSGIATGNKFAAQAAEIFHRYQETSRQMQNQAGAYIGKEEHYVTRQSHEMENIRAGGGDAARDAWRDFIEPKLAERTFEGVEDRSKFLNDVWKALASGRHDTANGADWLSGFTGPANLGKRVSQERKLHFKDARSWHAYNERYGHGNVVDSVLRGLEHAGRNTALMRALGTNPEAMLKSWVSDLQKAAIDRKDFKTSDALGGSWNDRIMDVVTGKASIPSNLRLAQIGQNIRNWESMAKLGGVVASSIPDIAVNAGTLRWNGVPLLEGYARTFLSPLLGRRSGETRQVADMLGVGIDGMTSRLLSRFHLEDRLGSGSKLLEIFHRANFLTYWTDSLKTGVGLILSNNLARNSAREFAALPERLQITMRRYGIEGPEWDAIRQAEKRAADGKDYLLPGSMADLPDAAIAHLAKGASPAELARVRDDLQTKLGSYVIDQSREAMTESRASDTAFATGGTQVGTPAGFAARLLMQFKQYPITYMRRSIGREMYRRDRVDVAGISYLIVGTTLLGAVAMTVKDLAKGRNPRDAMKEPLKFGLAAMQQGGGLGIYGDFLFGNANRMGGGFLSSAAGPAAGTLDDAFQFFTALRDGSNTRTRGQVAASEGLQGLKNNAPFINMIYSRAVLDYFILHRLQEAANPGYLRRYEERVKKQNAQTFWLRPSSSPYR